MGGGDSLEASWRCLVVTEEGGSLVEPEQLVVDSESTGLAPIECEKLIAEINAESQIKFYDSFQ